MDNRMDSAITRADIELAAELAAQRSVDKAVAIITRELATHERNCPGRRIGWQLVSGIGALAAAVGGIVGALTAQLASLAS